MKFPPWALLLRLAEIPLAKFGFTGTVVVPAISGIILFLRDNASYRGGALFSNIEIPAIFLLIYISTVTYALATVLVQLFAPEVIKRFRLKDEYARFILGQIELLTEYRAHRGEEQDSDEEKRRIYQAAVDHVVDASGRTWKSKDEQYPFWRGVAGVTYAISMLAGAYVAFVYTPLRVLEAARLRPWEGIGL